MNNLSYTEKNKLLQCFLLFVAIILIANPLLAIDSLQVSWSTYIGGSESSNWNTISITDEINAMTTDSAGNFYVTGKSFTTNLPSRTNTHTTNNSCAFVTKLDPAGIIQWTTYIGGDPASGGSEGIAICTDTDGENIFVTGKTPTSANFPELLNPDWQSAGAFVTSLNASNGSIRWSRLLTRYAAGEGKAVCIHDGQLFVTGLIGPYGELDNPQNSGLGNGEAFLYNLTTSGTVESCCFFGGSKGREYGNALFIDDQSCIYLAGEIFWDDDSLDYDLPGEMNEWRGQQCDGFVCKLDSDLNVLWSRYIGGSNYDFVYGITGDNQGSVWITGKSSSDDPGDNIVGRFGGDIFTTDGYIAKINTNDASLEWTSFAGRWGGSIIQPKLLPCRKILTISLLSASTHGLQLFDADLGNNQWFLAEDNFLQGGEPSAFKDIFVDETMNIYVGGFTPAMNTSFPNRNNEHSAKGSDGFVIKTHPKDYFYHFNQMGNALPAGLTTSTPDAWSVEDGKLTYVPQEGNDIWYAYFDKVFSNYNFEVQCKKTKGDETVYGLAFNADPNSGIMYNFNISIDGTYCIDMCDGSSWEILIDWISASFIKKGLNQCNVLKITARDSIIQFYCNGGYLNEIKIEKFLHGQLGVYTLDRDDGVNEVKFDNFYIGSYLYDMTGVAPYQNHQIKPVDFTLFQNFPNPFNPTTSINYFIDTPDIYELNIYNTKGEFVINLFNRYHSKGNYLYQLHLDHLASGVYIYQLKNKSTSVNKLMTLIK